jgi:hypothetical protein
MGRAGKRLAWLLLLTAGSGAATPPEDLVARYAGTYEIDALLAEPAVAEALRQVAGDRVEQIERNLSVTGPVDLISGWLTVIGNAPHGGTEHEAVVCVRPEPLVVHAAVLELGAIYVFAGSEPYMNVALCVKDWITQVRSQHVDRLRQPAGVTMMRPDQPAGAASSQPSD